MEVMYGSPSVSYTHLDVYKRQDLFLAVESGPKRLPCNFKSLHI